MEVRRPWSRPAPDCSSAVVRGSPIARAVLEQGPTMTLFLQLTVLSLSSLPSNPVGPQTGQAQCPWREDRMIATPSVKSRLQIDENPVFQKTCDISANLMFQRSKGPSRGSRPGVRPQSELYNSRLRRPLVRSTGRRCHRHNGADLAQIETPRTRRKTVIEPRLRRGQSDIREIPSRRSPTLIRSTTCMPRTTLPNAV